MSMIDPDDVFNSIVSGLEDELNLDVVVQPVNTMPDGNLLREYAVVKRQLLESGEMLKGNPSEPIKELQSRHSALVVELRRRGLA